MRSKRAILHRAVTVVAVVAAVVAVAGCSSVEPEDAWDSETGRVNGTIRSDTGGVLPDIEIWLWAELAPDGHEVCYQTVTGTDGTYEINGVEMATQQSTSTDYWIAANIAPDATAPIRSNYGAQAMGISVPSDVPYVWDAVLEYIDDEPIGPETYIEE
ncbi:MAG TPA: hypothetical protein VE960_02655 [bacterium]|nr:hypothetical protein [bacterium]